jgi:hypothetical protein
LRHRRRNLGFAHNNYFEAVTLAHIMTVKRTNADEGFEACTVCPFVGQLMPPGLFTGRYTAAAFLRCPSVSYPALLKRHQRFFTGFGAVLAPGRFRDLWRD